MVTMMPLSKVVELNKDDVIEPPVDSGYNVLQSFATTFNTALATRMAKQVKSPEYS